MTRAAELIAYLLARSPGRLLIDRRSGLPYGWSLWMRSPVERAAAFRAAELVAHVQTLPRPASSGLAPRLSYWQAFRRLWWQRWEPRPRDERPLHWLAVLGSLFVHVGFVLLLLWVALVSWAPQENEPEGERVALEFIGSGTPQVGDGAGRGEPAGEAGDEAAAPAASAQSAPAPQARRPAPAVAPAPAPQDAPDAPTSQAPVADTPTIPAPEPVATPEREAMQAAVADATPPPPTIEIERPVVQVDPRPLQATEVEQPTVEFVVPPLPAVTTATIEPRSRPAQVRERPIDPLAERPQVVPLRNATPATVELPRANAPAVREREIVVVDRPQLPAARAPELRVPQRQPAMPAPDVAVREIELKPVPDPAPAPEVASVPAPAPEPAPAAAAPAQDQAPKPEPARASTPAAAPAATATAARPAEAPASSPASGRAESTGPAAPGRTTSSSSSSTASSAPRASAAAGDDWSRQRGDDWGLGTREQAGAASAGEGVFGRDGGVNVPGATQGDPPRGAPNSASDTWSRERIAQSGTWLKRPPYDYTPTSLDQYWVPNESLLAEWVRSGIKQIDIAIPGTTSRITCVVSLLQFGGGCGLSDPNMNEQPATARPPPDIPFKKDLQENNGSVR